MSENEIGTIVVDCAVRLHKELGPGLLETVYEVLLAHRLRERGLTVERQASVPIQHDGIRLDAGFKADLIIEQKVIVELKSVESLNRAHQKQVLTYLKLADKRLGFLLNFGRPVMKTGIRRIVNGLKE
ncbi:MAG TPA: GxxExxY protein [Rhodothermia bacterium]|nr:GxxExxY protein [Rhodothermia bacterium]